MYPRRLARSRFIRKIKWPEQKTGRMMARRPPSQQGVGEGICTVYRPVRREKTGTVSSSRLWSWTSCVNKWQLIKATPPEKTNGENMHVDRRSLLGDPVGSRGGGGR